MWRGWISPPLASFGFLRRMRRATPHFVWREKLCARDIFGGAAFNAAKEVALDRFIVSDIGFLDMAQLVEAVLRELDHVGDLNTVSRDLQDILQVDQATRELARTLDV